MEYTKIDSTGRQVEIFGKFDSLSTHAFVKAEPMVTPNVSMPSPKDEAPHSVWSASNSEHRAPTYGQESAPRNEPLSAGLLTWSLIIILVGVFLMVLSTPYGGQHAIPAFMILLILFAVGLAAAAWVSFRQGSPAKPAR